MTATLETIERGFTPDEAVAAFDALPAVPTAALRGRWQGSEVPTGHPMDGVLTASGWYGKQFDDDEAVHPLIFETGRQVLAANPRRVPLSLAGLVPLPLVRASRSFLWLARPIIDSFRQVDARTVLGMVDFRDNVEPYFFVLRAETGLDRVSR